MAQQLPPRLPSNYSQPPMWDGNRSPGPSAVWIAAGAVALIGILGIGFTFWWMHHARELPTPEHLTVAEKHQLTRDAFIGNNLKASDQESRAITAALESLNTSMGAHDFAGVAAVYDTDRLWDELDQMGALKNIPSSQLNASKASFSNGATRVLAERSALAWSAHAVKKIAISTNRREAVVYDLETRGTGTTKYTVKMRWWMDEDRGQWKVWDFEMLEQGVRASALSASALETMDRNGQSTALNATSILKSLPVDISAKNWTKMEADLKQFDAMSMPAEFSSIRQTYWGILHLRQQKYTDCLKDCDAIEASGQDVPMIYQFRAESYNHLGKYDQALKSCDNWQDALGDESELFFQRGTALEHLNRTIQARAAFEKCLDQDPDAAAALAELSKTLPAAEGKSEIGRRFLLSRSQHAVFTNAMPVLHQARDLKGMQAMIDAYSGQPGAADDDWLTYYRGEMHILHKDYAQGEKTLQPLLPIADKPGQKVFASEYYYAAALANDAVNAYQSSSDAKTAFHELAPRLYRAGKYPALKELTTAHLARFPDDSGGFFYQGCYLEHARDFDAAETAYVKAASLATGTEVEEIRGRRVYSRYAAGKGLSAYQEIEPKDKTFQQLAILYSSHKQGDQLAQLVQLRKADAPDEVATRLYDAEAKFMAADFAGAVATLATVHPERPVDSYKWSNLYIRSQVRLKDFDAARHEAERVEYARDWHFAIIESAAGNVAAATMAFDAVCRDEEEFGLERLYSDPDIGPALAAPAFAGWRAAHPMPTTQPTTRPAAT